MRAFWWFEENAIAGMARPGFNGTPWFEFSFEEALLVGWLGQFPSGQSDLDEFREHVQTYGNKIRKFYPIAEREAQEALAKFSTQGGLLNVMERVRKRSGFLRQFEVTDSHMRFEFCPDRLGREMEVLKKEGIRTVVSLTESHLNREALKEHFEAVHFSINDLDAPTLEQVQGLAEVIRGARERKEGVAVHCLAGIGRTSTMLIGAHMVLGESLEKMKALIARRNPVFVFAGRQKDFLHSLEEELR